MACTLRVLLYSDELGPQQAQSLLVAGTFVYPDTDTPSSSRRPGANDYGDTRTGDYLVDRRSQIDMLIIEPLSLWAVRAGLDSAN